MHRANAGWISLALLGLWAATAVAQSGNLPTSLHATRVGKDYWYGTANGGFETLTNVPIEQLGCTECHGPTDANGDAYADPYPGMDCIDCHPDAPNFFDISQDQCLGCHSRQKTEISLGFTDVHRDAGMTCWDCHKHPGQFDDVHGDGTEYDTMFAPGAISADCENSGCHPTLPGTHDSYDPHGGKLHCAACHAQTVISCYNCHFESQVQAHVKRAKQQLSGFVILANRERDGKVGTMSFQSLTNQGDAFVAFGPFASHTITRTGARSCSDCHANMGGTIDAIEEYNDTGEIHFATWDDTGKTLSWLQGVVPMPFDYQGSFKMDFITYDGDPSDPAGPSTNWSSIGKNTWDGHQMFFATPLTQQQMASLGFDVVPAVSSVLRAAAGPDGIVLRWNVRNAPRIDRLDLARSTNDEPWTVLESWVDNASTEGVWTDSAAPAGSNRYRAVARVDGVEIESNVVEISREIAIPRSRLLAAAPNPFNPKTEIRFALAEAGEVTLQIHDVAGRVVRTFDLGHQSAGAGSVGWDGTDSGGRRVASGSYLVRLVAGRSIDEMAVTLLK